MRRRSLYTQTDDSINPFQSFTDLITNAFMILSLLLFLALLQSWNLNKRLETANKRLQSATPIVIDEKSGKFEFQSGSAELKPELKNYISSEIVPTIKKIIQEREIDFVQVIGHTDGQGINYTSNLDTTLEAVANSNQPVSKLIPGSNADLGLMRALSVVQELEKSRLNIKFRAYSAAQIYLPSGDIAQTKRSADETRRRIEIRFIPPGEQK